jgi:hypothetical protein
MGGRAAGARENTQRGTGFHLRQIPLDGAWARVYRGAVFSSKFLRMSTLQLSWCWFFRGLEIKHRLALSLV